MDVENLRRSGVLLTGKRILIRRATDTDAADLACILSQDKVLGRALSSNTTEVTIDAQRFLSDVRTWERNTSSICMAIVERNGPAIGSISRYGLNG